MHLWTGGKQAQYPPGPLDTIVLLVEGSSLKGRSPCWFTVRKTTCFTKMPLVNFWPCDFTDVTALSSQFFLALHYCFFFYTFFLLWLLICPPPPPLFFKFFFNEVLFHGCVVLFQGHLSPLTAAFSGCFFGLFCPVLLVGGVLALLRAPISSNWFFVWHSFGPSSTQLLVRNRSGFCSHWYLAGLIFLQSTSFYRLCFSLPPCFSFKWFCSF